MKSTIHVPQKRYPFLFCFLFILCQHLLLAQSEGKPRFTQNKGQWEDRTLFHLPLQGGGINFEADRLTYCFMEPDYFDHDHHALKEEKELKTVFNGHMYQTIFLNANPKAACIGQKAYTDVTHYYLGNDPNKWAENVHSFEEITYKDIYPNIDVHFYQTQNTLKYDFIVHSGGDPHQIQVQYLGIDNLRLIDHDIHIQTTVNSIKELAPIAFQHTSTPQNVPCEYHLQDNILTYQFPNGWDYTQTLIIDPTLIFSTFTGSTQDNWGFTATYDNAGNAYAGGIVYNPGFLSVGSTGYPTTPGAFQTSFQGGVRDAVITKFNSDGTALLFSTYLGGNDEDQPHSMVVNSMQELFIMGKTLSSNFPTSNNAYDETFNGGSDMYITKLGSNGNLISSTFVGGSGDDAGNGYYLITGDTLNYNYGDDTRGEIDLDLDENPIIVSSTRSSDFPTTPNAFQDSIGGIQDAIILKLNNDLSSLMLSTYLGGATMDAGYSIKADSTDVLYIAGGTTSAYFPTTTGAIYENPQGSADGFIAKISADGTSLLASTYLGTATYDQCHFLQIDKNKNIYVTGQTLGNFPVINANYFVNNSRQFITKLNNSLTNIIFSTTYGTPNATQVNICPTAFQVDKDENLFIAGWGGMINTYLGANGNTNGMPITPTAYQSITDGSDFYFMVLKSNASALLYGTYFGSSGEEHADATSARISPEGVLYQGACAGCGGSLFPITPGVWGPTNNSNNCNMALIKLDFDVSGSLSTEQWNDADKLSVYPNPNTGVFTVDMLLQNAADVSIRIMDVSGRVVYATQKAGVITMNESIDLSDFAKGIYMMNVVTSNGRTTVKLVIE